MARRALYPIFSCPYREHAPTPCYIVLYAYACIHAHLCNPPSENSGYRPVLLSLSLSLLLSYSLLLRFSFPSLCLTHMHTHTYKNEWSHTKAAIHELTHHLMYWMCTSSLCSYDSTSRRIVEISPKRWNTWAHIQCFWLYKLLTFGLLLLMGTNFCGFGK